MTTSRQRRYLRLRARLGLLVDSAIDCATYLGEVSAQNAFERGLFGDSGPGSAIVESDSRVDLARLESRIERIRRQLVATPARVVAGFPPDCPF